jgi:hypothetical protein
LWLWRKLLLLLLRLLLLLLLSGGGSCASSVCPAPGSYTLLRGEEFG